MKRIGLAALELVIALMIAVVVTERPAFADMGNYQNYIVGNRAAGMGGAVVAGSNDIDSAYYNPAGLAHVDGHQLSLSASLYGIYRVSVSDGIGPDESYRARAFESIPSVFGSILKVSDDFALAFSVFTPSRPPITSRKPTSGFPLPPPISTNPTISPIPSMKIRCGSGPPSGSV